MSMLFYASVIARIGFERALEEQVKLVYGEPFDERYYDTLINVIEIRANEDDDEVTFPDGKVMMASDVVDYAQLDAWVCARYEQLCAEQMGY